MYLRRSRKHSPTQAMRSFSFFFFVVLLPLSYKQGKFRTSSAIRSSEAASRQVYSDEICEIFRNTYFEEHMRATAFSSSSFKLLDLIDLTIFPDLNLKLGKIKPFATVCITKFSRFCSPASSLLSYQVRKLRNFVFSFIFKELTSKIKDVSAVFL